MTVTGPLTANGGITTGTIQINGGATLGDPFSSAFTGQQLVSWTGIECINGFTNSGVLTTTGDVTFNTGTTSTNLSTALDIKANLSGCNFTGPVSGLTKATVGLNNVENTSDLSKVISTATQTALNTKANLAGPTFTGTVNIPTLNVTGSYGAYMKCTLDQTSGVVESRYGPGLAEIKWKTTPTFSYGLTMQDQFAIKFASAGVYAFTYQLHSNTSVATARNFQLVSRYSTDNSTYTDYEISEVNILFNGVEQLFLDGMIQVAANSYLRLRLINGNTADMLFDMRGQYSFLHVYRVG
jgi:hypothetical protein